jgi:hypothetical protein
MHKAPDSLYRKRAAMLKTDQVIRSAFRGLFGSKP